MNVLPFRPTPKHIYRLAAREVQKLYQYTGGGADPVVDADSLELFEMGLIDEPLKQSWGDFCRRAHRRLWEQLDE